MKLEDINKRIEEIPQLIDKLTKEYNQLLGYKQALLDMEEKKEPSEKKK
jgi:prefoldin subunit 5|tara:strand:+ start:298 stop:444 length:147 start_codon:yes stop_codon:yes gene_type:complete